MEGVEKQILLKCVNDEHDDNNTSLYYRPLVHKLNYYSLCLMYHLPSILINRRLSFNLILQNYIIVPILCN